MSTTPTTEALAAILTEHQRQVLLSMRPGHRAGAGCSCGWHSHSETYEQHAARLLAEAAASPADSTGPVHLLRGYAPPTGGDDGGEVLVHVWSDGTGEVAYQPPGGQWGPPSPLSPAP